MSRARSRAIKVFKRAVDKAHDILASKITIYYKSGDLVSCPTCDWDPVLKESLDPNCPACNGNFYLVEILTKIIDATVAWGGLGDQYRQINVPGGPLDVNDACISCKLADVLVDPSSTAGNTILHPGIAVKIDIGGDFVTPLTTPIKSGIAGEFYTAAVRARKEVNPLDTDAS